MEDVRSLLVQLIDHALTAPLPKFKKLHSGKAYLSARATRKALRVVVTDLHCASKKCFKKYCKTIHNEKSDLNYLLAYNQLLRTFKFYNAELQIIEESIKDYECYLFKGNFIKAFLLSRER